MPSVKNRPLRLRSLREASLRTCMIRGLRGLAISVRVGWLGIGGSWWWPLPFRGLEAAGGPPPQPSPVPTGEGVRESPGGEGYTPSPAGRRARPRLPLLAGVVEGVGVDDVLGLAGDVGEDVVHG